MEIERTDGYLAIWTGPMFSGKTTQLIQIYKQYSYIGEDVCVVNYHLDTRYHDTMLSTHDQLMIPCLQTSHITNIMEQARKSDVILINEGQFFPDLFYCVIELVEKYNKKVYVSALDGDFKREKFGKILDLIPYCDQFTKLNSLCSQCKNGRKALFSHRVSDESAQIVIGSDNYIPLCRKCYIQSNCDKVIDISVQPSLESY
jgi:thymidine kinase